MGCETEIDFRMDLVIGCVFWGWGGLDLLVCVCFYCGLFFFLFDVLLGDVCVLCLLLWELVCTYLESGNRYMFSGYG